MPLFTSGGRGLGLKNLVLFTSLLSVRHTETVVHVIKLFHYRFDCMSTRLDT